MIRKIVRIEYAEYGSEYFPERYAWVYLEGSGCIPEYEVTGKDLEKMAFGC